MKKALITQSNYIPWKGYFDAINSADALVLYDHVQYTRRDWRNRNIIKTPAGLHWLTIPVNVKGNYHAPINEISVSDPGWAEKHWKTICQNYKRAPHFKAYEDFFSDLYLNCRHQLLSEINGYFLQAICRLLDISTPFRWSTEFDLQTEDRSRRLLDICLELGATHYMSGPKAKEYMDVELFYAHGVEVEWLDYSGYEPYAQLHGPFEHGVSIIDLIFNTGSESPRYMKSFAHRLPA